MDSIFLWLLWLYFALLCVCVCASVCSCRDRDSDRGREKRRNGLICLVLPHPHTISHVVFCKVLKAFKYCCCKSSRIIMWWWWWWWLYCSALHGMMHYCAVPELWDGPGWHEEAADPDPEADAGLRPWALHIPRYDTTPSITSSWLQICTSLKCYALSPNPTNPHNGQCVGTSVLGT